MKGGSLAAFVLVTTNFLNVVQSAPLGTSQNSTLSVPSASLVAAGLPGATNLVGSNFLLSAVSPGTSQGGHASLVPSQRWVQRYGEPVSFRSAAYAMVVRRDGCVIVAGPSAGPNTGYWDDFVTLCYAADGTPLWTNRFDGPAHGEDTAQLLAADPNGNVWVVGKSTRDASPTNTTLTDVVTIKYGSDGVPIWTNRYSSFETNGAFSQAVVVDGEGNAYVRLAAAYWKQSTGTPVEDAIIKYDALGNVVWTKHYFASAPDSGHGLHSVGPMAVDVTGNLFVAGSSGSANYHTGDSIVKFTGDGTAVWTNFNFFGFNAGFNLLSVDQQGDIIVTGEIYTSSSSNYESSFVMKCSKGGASLWTNVLAGPNYSGGGVPRSAVDPVGNVFLIGGTPGFGPGFYRILKTSNDGIPLWTNQNANLGSTNSVLTGSAVDNAGNLYLAGYAPVSATGKRDYVTMKFSGEGHLVWSNRFNGTANGSDLPFALAVSSAGEVYLSGQSESQPGTYDFATVKYADLLFYSPPKDFVGLDTITCSLTDYLGNPATGTVDVVVSPGAFRFVLSPTATRMTPSGMVLKVEGAPGTNALILEASPDAMSWQRISTNTPNQGSAQFLDPSASSRIQRLYRVTQEQ